MILDYSYVDPLGATGDSIRVKAIIEGLSAVYNKPLMATYLSEKDSTLSKNKVRYFGKRRRISLFIPKQIANTRLVSEFIKIFQLILDEPILIITNAAAIRSANIIIVHGSMSIAPIILRLLNKKITIIYDPLSNYVQSLYSKISFKRSVIKSVPITLRLGAFLAVQKVSFRNSNLILFPAKNDEENAIVTYKLSKNETAIVPNPFPVVYQSSKEFETLRQQYRKRLCSRSETKILILTAGNKSEVNEEAVKLLLKLSSQCDFKLIITGPWEEYAKTGNPKMLVTGKISQAELKGLLAASDVGLCPIFYGSGTFLKCLSYMGAGLEIIGTPIVKQSTPVDMAALSSTTIHVASSEQDFLSLTQKFLSKTDESKQRRILTEDSAQNYLTNYLKELKLN